MAIDKLVEEILTIVNTLEVQDMSSLSDDTLSRLILKLASYKASLGVHVAEAYKAALDAEAEYQNARATEYKRLRDEGKGSTDAAELKNLAMREPFLAWNEKRRQLKLLDKLSVDCHDLIDSIKGRLINLHTERQEANVT